MLGCRNRTNSSVLKSCGLAPLFLSVEFLDFSFAFASTSRASFTCGLLGIGCILGNFARSSFLLCGVAYWDSFEALLE